VRNIPIDSKYLDMHYPEFMYFYLYGTPDQQHIEHLLVSAKNVQLTSDQVQLALSNGVKLSPDDLAKGVIIRLEDVREETVLPVLPPNTPPFFKAGTSHDIAIFSDTHTRDAHGPGLTTAYAAASPIASGRMTLGKMIYSDSVMLNDDPSANGAKIKADSVKGRTLEERLAATRRQFESTDPTHADGYYKRREKQAAWQTYLEEKMTSVGRDPAGGDLISQRTAF
jgi:hypothetical protein